MRISDWSSDVCSSDLGQYPLAAAGRGDDPVRSVLSRMADVPGGGRRMRRARRTVRGVARRHSGAAGAGGAHPVESRAPADRIMLLPPGNAGRQRSEEHTSELQSLMRISYAVFCLKKKKNK